MALSSGFPAANTISPDVYIREIDQTLIVPPTSTHNTGLVGFASKGPINTPTLISSRQQLYQTFGYPHPSDGDPYMIYAGEQFLNASAQLYCVRVAQNSPVSNEQATTASISVPDAGVVASFVSDTVGPYTFSTESFFRWRLNGVLASKTLVVLSGTYSVSQLVADLNSQLVSSIDGIEFFVSGSNTIGVETTFSYGTASSLEMVSVQDSIYGGLVIHGNITGLGTGMTQAQIVGTASKYPNNTYTAAGQYNFAGLTGLNLLVVIEGTDNPQIDDITQVIDLFSVELDNMSLTPIISAINSQALGFTATATGNNLTLTTSAHGEDSAILVKASSTAASLFGLSTITAAGTSPSGVATDANTYYDGIVTGAAGSGGITFTLNADSPGIEGNNTQVVVATNSSNGTFSLSVYSNGNSVEAWGGLTKDQTSTLYVGTALQTSNYISVMDNTDDPAPPLPGTYSLTGGTDGIPADPDTQDQLLIGNLVGMTGMYALSDPEQVDIDLLAIPGHPSTDVIVAMLDMCENIRQDCFVIIDPPFGLSVTEIVDWQNGVHPLNLVQFNSSFGALYWPWLNYTDITNGIDVWVPPSGSVLATYAVSDDNSGPWEAPAGYTRGVVQNINDVFSRPTKTERNQMYGFQNAVNPIVMFTDSANFLIFGAKTLDRDAEALNRVPTRRMLLYAEKAIKAVSRQLLFEPNDQILWNQFITLATNVLEGIKAARGMVAYKVQCDANTNTQSTIEMNELIANIEIQPEYDAEFIFITFTLTNDLVNN